MDACHESIEWVRANNITTPADAWSKCDRGDWMLWFAGKRSGEPEGNGRKKLVLACCECARLALPHATSPTALACIETAEAWAHGGATIEQVREAKTAAYAAADAAYAYAYAVAASDAAAYAAYASDAAAYAAYAASYAAAAYAAYAAAYAAYAASYIREKALKQCAEIVRKHYPKYP